MGRIKTSLIKRVTLKLFNENKDKLFKDFTKNKKVVGEMLEIHSKKLRNVIAGYTTRLMKQENKKIQKT